MKKGQELWRKSLGLIPGGSLLLSKNADRFLPGGWPAYFSRAKGCHLWDLEGDQYLDMSMMGVGTNTLGYCHPEVDAAVHKTVDAGNLATLNCPEEVELAERLVALHPWADMVRFARSGGEANAISIRIARAVSGKDQVAFCGYHGWHDWYLAANLANGKHLDGHLMEGLEPSGVPRNLAGTCIPFRYNELEELEQIVAEHDIGVIKMEVMRNIPPKKGFLEGVRKLATAKGIVLIFDECTSGFREALGGLHKKYGIAPDVAVFGKALGNGYAITAVVGRREIMEAAHSTFLSSTFWTERIGPTAALKTLEVMERDRSYEAITQIGTELRTEVQRIAATNRLELDFSGLPSLSSFTFANRSNQILKTFITQEMLKQGILATTSIYVCTDHTVENQNRYCEALAPVFEKLGRIDDKEARSLVHGPLATSGFQRLN